jgi:hypothetical protein
MEGVVGLRTGRIDWNGARASRRSRRAEEGNDERLRCAPSGAERGRSRRCELLARCVLGVGRTESSLFRERR